MEIEPPKSDGNALDIYLARQSILDRGQNLRAFELLFRSSQQNRAEVVCATSATATVIQHAMHGLGIESVLGSYQGFINLDAEMLMSETIELLPRGKIGLEILETVEPTPAIVQRCRYLRDRGYTLAMDDYVGYEEALEPLLQVVHIVKIDLLSLDQNKLAKTVERLHRFNVQLLAEKVDSVEQFKYCSDLGFDLFQGYYFAKPEIITGKRLSTSEIVVMKLLGMLMADADTDKIEAVFKENPGLSINMLRLVNTVGVVGSRKVTSLTSALVILGRRQVQRWLQLLLFAQLSPCKEFPSPLLQLAATRGKFLELMAAGNRESEDHAFMTGIMSLMDALLGMPLLEIISGLPISDEVRDALLERKGRLGRMLILAETLENNDVAAFATAIVTFPDFTADQINNAQLQALSWANSISK